MSGKLQIIVKIFRGSISIALALIFLVHIAHAQQADADVVYVKAQNHGDRGWGFYVTVKHPDTGWDDYCNGWDVVTDKGIILKHNESDEFTRVLFHPHETEQPFTRSESRLIVPDDTSYLTVRAHDLIHGFGGQEVKILLSETKGENYEIWRQ
jgi:hypothetical protein